MSILVFMNTTPDVNDFVCKTGNYARFSSVSKEAAWSAAFDYIVSRPDASWQVECCEVGICGQPHGWAYILHAKPPVEVAA